ncbi:hypothetical protein ACPV5U_29665, partial [Vibrio mediterranei]
FKFALPSPDGNPSIMNNHPFIQITATVMQAWNTPPCRKTRMHTPSAHYSTSRRREVVETQ